MNEKSVWKGMREERKRRINQSKEYQVSSKERDMCLKCDWRCLQNEYNLHWINATNRNCMTVINTICIQLNEQLESDQITSFDSRKSSNRTGHVVLVISGDTTCIKLSIHEVDER